MIEPHVARVLVVSPSDTGIRQAPAKTDRLDARTLARLLAAASLDAVWMPDRSTWVMRGTRRLSLDVAARQRHTLAPAPAGNVASAARGAIAAGEGGGHANLIDETEATEWRRWARR